MPVRQDCLESGLSFIEFLGERTSKISKKELRDIYNVAFKNRDGNKYPNFSAVIYALQKFNKAYIKKGIVYINVKSQVRVHYGDQWRRPPGGQKGPSGTPAPPVVRGTQGSPTSSGSSPAPGPVTSQLTPRKRLAKDALNRLKMNSKELTADKGGIVITSDPVATDSKILVNVGRLGKLSTVKFHILNKGTGGVHFTLYTALHRISCFSLLDERRVTRTSPLLLSPGESYQVEAQYRLHHHGHFPATMYFEFCPDQPGSKPFCILREMEAWTRGALGMQLGPVEPYRPYQAAIRKPVNTVIVEGVRPESSVFHQLKMTVKLGEYIYPFYLKDLSRHNMEDSEYLSDAARQKLPSLRALLSCPLKMTNYSQRFHLLLHLEEIQMEVDIRRYDMRGQTMTQDRLNKKLLILQVPGVAENRPSVLRGDCIKISRSEEKVQPITVYTGYVHRVELDRVKMGLSKRLVQVFLGNMKFDVEFTLNRYPLKLQHRAVDLVAQHRLKKLLFPSASASTETPLPKLRMFNVKLENNPEQHAAIQRIVAGTSKPAPYLVFGPPGTGKTITLVEAMTQVDRAIPKACILACAPSNSAADLLCERLLEHLDPHRVYRLYASSRAPGTVPKNLQKHCNWDATQDCFVFPAKKVLMQYKVMVTTLVTAGRLVSGGIPAGHFSHVFVDEAGQAVEAECIIAVAGLLQAGEGQLVLAGDPQQLGPVLRSPLALQHGLGLSLLERLMKHNSLYQKTGKLGWYNKRFVTKLLRNYRSHPAILEIPNQLFYDSELQVFADQWERDTYRNWEYLPKKGFPVIFHGVMGKDEREANSPSFFNVSEIEVLVDYLTKLMETQGKKGLPKLSPRDIGIIAPYRKQVEKIQKALKSVKELHQWNDIKELKVGSVEEFQGQERKVVMVTTVRSSINYVKMDQDFNIGFLANKKRFNVAITRAKALLIVVGNPVILNKDPTWEKFIRYCVDKEGYTGFNHVDAEVEDDVVSRLASLKIHEPSESEQAACESGESYIQQHSHPEWRRDH